MAKLLCSLFPSFFSNIMGGWGGGGESSDFWISWPVPFPKGLLFIISLCSHALWEAPQMQGSLAASSLEALEKYSADANREKAKGKMLRITSWGLCPGMFSWELLQGGKQSYLPITLGKLWTFLFVSVEHKGSGRTGLCAGCTMAILFL